MQNTKVISEEINTLLIKIITTKLPSCVWRSTIVSKREALNVNKKNSKTTSAIRLCSINILFAVYKKHIKTVIHRYSLLVAKRRNEFSNIAEKNECNTF
ncbi:MAG TPA: hypothetical protein VIP70_01755 [Nitrososphaeraceae archaeon]